MARVIEGIKGTNLTAYRIDEDGSMWTRRGRRDPAMRNDRWGPWRRSGYCAGGTIELHAKHAEYVLRHTHHTLLNPTPLHG